jgi:hypothetical protein
MNTELRFDIAQRPSLLFLEVSRAGQTQLEESESQLRGAILAICFLAIPTI